MANIPLELMNLLTSPEARINVGFVNNGGEPVILPKGKLMIIDEETVAFADRVNIKLLTEFKTNAKAAIHASSKEDRFGYFIKGTFREYKTS